MIKIIPVPGLKDRNLVQIRFPKSKRRRIRRKWAKDRRYFALIDKEVCIHYKELNVFFVSTSLYEKLSKDPDMAPRLVSPSDVFLGQNLRNDIFRRLWYGANIGVEHLKKV